MGADETVVNHILICRNHRSLQFISSQNFHVSCIGCDLMVDDLVVPGSNPGEFFKAEL